MSKELYHEVKGSGPLLLLIAGGTDDARDFTAITPLLTDHYTVISYDCRGISRSRPDGPPADVSMETQVEDARSVLEAAGGGPAHVFGNSSGGLTALALAARHPHLVRTVVTHEPPAISLLPADDPRRNLGREVDEAYRNGGVGAAMAVFAAGAGLDKWDPNPPGGITESPEAMTQMQAKLARMQTNLEFFFGHAARSYLSYEPVVDPRNHVVVAVGEQSRGQLAHDTALALAERLGVRPITVPGGHAGFVTHPTAFAHELRHILSTS
ncbi:alpha/beta fold hydrolase [Nonomuraea pusilla]|uniref:Pimeloyl-ACP methyl ester carboxylesterase n=1 Tax=Nonomuraea pusilla TaxID=46177 RepID=A0A1H7INA5_9ACTN|nr:alpha/beta hydrolase [Nonomuraea pusilla]SEK63898.1 Pimeloyl-ACP methyl ester carboxylesterase [Nonomuraea pusilla]